MHGMPARAAGMQCSSSGWLRSGVQLVWVRAEERAGQVRSLGRVSLRRNAWHVEDMIRVTCSTDTCHVLHVTPGRVTATHAVG